MKKRSNLFLIALAFFYAGPLFSQINNPKTVATEQVDNHANNDMSSGINNTLNKGENGIKNAFKKKNKDTSGTYKEFTKNGKIISHSISIDAQTSALQPQSMNDINTIYTLMKNHGDLKIEIGGNTADDGNATQDMAQSQRCADAVKAQLVSKGIAASRLVAKGYGMTRPIDTNTTPEGKANNNRVEFVKM